MWGVHLPNLGVPMPVGPNTLSELNFRWMCVAVHARLTGTLCILLKAFIGRKQAPDSLTLELAA